jgi:hypothetical protein
VLSSVTRNLLPSPWYSADYGPMRFGIFYEHQLPRPWAPGDEHRLLADALEQVKLADRLGIDYLWEAERHLPRASSACPRYITHLRQSATLPRRVP